MPPALLLLPAALLLAGAAAALAPALPARLIGLCAAVTAAAAALVLFVAGGGTLELAPGTLGAGIPAAFRLDGVALAGAVAILVPGAVLMARRSEAVPARLAMLAAAYLAVTSADLVLLAVAAGTAVALGVEEARPASTWTLWAGVLIAATAGAALQWTGGTATYGAAPASALTPGIAGLVLLAAALLSGALPVQAWAQQSWRGSPGLLAALPPIGLSLLFRLYQMGDGRLPSVWLNGVLAAWAVIVMLGAAWRAQAAADGDGVLREALPELAACGLLAAAAGSLLGGAALALIMLATGILATLILAGETERPAGALVAAALVAAVPATLGFGARLLALQAMVEGQPLIAVAALPGALAWLVWIVACVRLPGLAAPRARRAVAWRALAIAAASALAGAGLGPLVNAVGLPAARAAGLGSAGPHPGVGIVSLNPASGGWDALAAGVILAGLTAAAIALQGWPALPRIEPPLPAPPAWTPPKPALAPPFRLATIERALSGPRPLVWGIVIGVLAVSVARMSQQ